MLDENTVEVLTGSSVLQPRADASLPVLQPIGQNQWQEGWEMMKGVWMGRSENVTVSLTYAVFCNLKPYSEGPSFSNASNMWIYLKEKKMLECLVVAKIILITVQLKYVVALNMSKLFIFRASL